MELFDINNSKEIATYNGGIVTEDEVYKLMNMDKQLPKLIAMSKSRNQEEHKQFLYHKRFVANQIAAGAYILKSIPQDLLEKHKAQVNEEVNKEDKFLVEQAKDKHSFANLTESLRQRSLTVEEYKRQKLMGLAVNNHLEKQLIGKTYPSVNVWHILVMINTGANKNPKIIERTEQQAKERIEEAHRQASMPNSDFAKLAQTYSDDQMSAKQGGMVEGCPKLFFPNFCNACETLPLNILSGLVRTEAGYHILRVLKREVKQFTDAPPYIKGMQLQSLFMQLLVSPQVGFKSNLPVPPHSNNRS